MIESNKVYENAHLVDQNLPDPDYIQLSGTPSHDRAAFPTINILDHTTNPASSGRSTKSDCIEACEVTPPCQVWEDIPIEPDPVKTSVPPQNPYLPYNESSKSGEAEVDDIRNEPPPDLARTTFYNSTSSPSHQLPKTPRSTGPTAASGQYAAEGIEFPKISSEDRNEKSNTFASQIRQMLLNGVDPDPWQTQRHLARRMAKKKSRRQRKTINTDQRSRSLNNPRIGSSSSSPSGSSHHQKPSVIHFDSSGPANQGHLYPSSRPVLGRESASLNMGRSESATS